MRIPALILAAAMAAAPASVQAQSAPARPAPSNYASDKSWLCLPGRNDICSTPLATTALNPNGYGSNGISVVAKDPPIDCFYVYPTVSRDSGLNSDMNPGPEETGAAASQFARFSGTLSPAAMAGGLLCSSGTARGAPCSSS
jgi:hypothetical protein